MYDDLFKGIEEIIRGISSQVELTFSTIQSNDALNRFAEQVKNYLLELQKDENLSREEYEAKYANEKATAEELGKAGWVITQHSNPHDVGEWKDILYSSDSKSIELVFLGENEYILSSIVRELNDLYDNDEGLYYKKGIEFFEGEDYMTAAMYLTCQIDYRCKKLIDFGNSKKTRDIFSTRGFRDHLQREFSDEKGSITKKYLFLDMYPSLITFLNRLFVDGQYVFENGKEPPYINRNWLLHGRCRRIIERYECIQLLNALNVLEFVCRIGRKREE